MEVFWYLDLRENRPIRILRKDPTLKMPTQTSPVPPAPTRITCSPIHSQTIPVRCRWRRHALPLNLQVWVRNVVLVAKPYHEMFRWGRNCEVQKLFSKPGWSFYPTVYSKDIRDTWKLSYVDPYNALVRLSCTQRMRESAPVITPYDSR